VGAILELYANVLLDFTVVQTILYKCYLQNSEHGIEIQLLHVDVVYYCYTAVVLNVSVASVVANCRRLPCFSSCCCCCLALSYVFIYNVFYMLFVTYDCIFYFIHYVYCFSLTILFPPLYLLQTCKSCCSF
jgi:hypothetical protein